MNEVYQHPELRKFHWNPSKIYLSDVELKSGDVQIDGYEKEKFDFKEVEKLREKNALLSSFAISKMERTNTLKIEDMRQLRKYYLAGNDVLISETTDNQKAYDELEFFNINRGLDKVSPGIKPSDLSVDLLKNLHITLTEGLDNFTGTGVKDFSDYNTGELRDCLIYVGKYTTPPQEAVKDAVEEIIACYKKNPTLENIGLTSIAMYAIHPFRNGNKRLCRMLEHGLMLGLGLNKNNTYNHSYYYWQNLDRFIGITVEKSLIGKSFNHSVNMFKEGIFYSQLNILRYSVERQRVGFIAQADLPSRLKTIVEPLIKTKSLQTKTYIKRFKKTDERVIRRHISDCVESGVLYREMAGKSVFYSLNLPELPEETLIKKRIWENSHRLPYIPKNMEKSIFSPLESWSKTGGITSLVGGIGSDWPDAGAIDFHTLARSP